MQFKPITAIVVLLIVVASLLVSGCTSSTNSNQAASNILTAATKTANITTKAASASATPKPTPSVVPTPTYTTSPLPTAIVGSFSGTSSILPGATTDTGTGFLTYIGWSNFKGHQLVYPGSPYTITITTATGSISLHVPPTTSGGIGGGSTYYIDGGTGQFARVRGGSGLFSLDYDSTRGEDLATGAFIGNFTAHLDGTIVFA